MMNELTSFAAWASSLTWDSLPEPVRVRARLTAADSIGAIIGGYRATEPRLLAESRFAARADGSSSGAELFCPGSGYSDEKNAAFSNSVAMAWMEMDEGSRPSGHPALHVLPPLLARGQTIHASGQDLLTAFVAGYEAQARVQWATSLKKEVHPHGNLGHVGAAVGLAKLAGFNAEQIASSALIAANLAGATSWTSAVEGSTVRNAYASQSVDTAFRVVQLVSAGITGSPAALEDTFGVILGSDFQPARLSEDLGGSYHLLNNYFKFHSACAVIHSALDATADALEATERDHSFPVWDVPRVDPAEIRSVEVLVPERALKLAGREVASDLGSRFSIPNSIATLISRGSCGPEDQELSWPDPEVAMLRKRIKVEGSAEYERAWPRELVSRVRIDMSDGRRLEALCSNPIGSGDRHVTQATLKAKFQQLVEWTGRDAERMWDLYVNLHHQSELHSLFHEQR